MQVMGRSKDALLFSRTLLHRLTEVGRVCRPPESGEGLGPPSSSPSHVIFQRDLEYSLSRSLIISTINITDCSSLVAPRKAKGFTSRRLFSDSKVASLVALLPD